MIRLVLFDIDGTLIYSRGAGVRAFLGAYAMEFHELPDGAASISFAGRTDTGLVREFFRLHRYEPKAEDFQRFFDRYVFLLENNLQSSGGGVLAGVRDWLRQLPALPQPPVVGLLTGNIRLGAEIKLRHFGLWESFVMGAFADDREERDKIAAVAFERGREMVGKDLRPEEVLVIGDTPLDIRCGRAIGAKVLAVATGGTKYEDLVAHRADWTVNSLTEISAAAVCG